MSSQSLATEGQEMSICRRIAVGRVGVPRAKFLQLLAVEKVLERIKLRCSEVDVSSYANDFSHGFSLCPRGSANPRRVSVRKSIHNRALKRTIGTTQTGVRGTAVSGCFFRIRLRIAPCCLLALSGAKQWKGHQNQQDQLNAVCNPLRPPSS